MRRFLLSLLLLMGLAACHSRQADKADPAAKHKLVKAVTKAAVEDEDESVFESLDYKTLLSRLFDKPRFDSTGAASWRPTYYERMSFPVSYDGNCHTKIDTVLYFTDREKRKCACVILTTLNYQKSELNDSVVASGCHFCGVPIGVALLAETEAKKWKLYKFEKAFTSLGYFGTYRTGGKDAGKISLKEIGDKWTCLSLRQGVGGNMGEFSGYESMYSIEQFHLNGFPEAPLELIFRYTYHYELYNSDDKKKDEQHIEMKILKRKNDYYPIDLLVTKNGRASTEHYRYSDNADQYIKYRAAR